jgi:hypothetical protein
VGSKKDTCIFQAKPFCLSKHRIKAISLLAGIIIAGLLYFINPFHVPESAARVLAVAGLMITGALALPYFKLLSQAGMY